jgi:hypothetical protein
VGCSHLLIDKLLDFAIAFGPPAAVVKGYSITSDSVVVLEHELSARIGIWLLHNFHADVTASGVLGAIEFVEPRQKSFAIADCDFVHFCFSVVVSAEAPVNRLSASKEN